MAEFLLWYILIINAVTFLVYGADKRKAVKGRWRISEKALLALGFAGGSIGQIAGMKFFRHKTQKWYFVFSGYVFFILHCALLYLCFAQWKIM